MVFYFGWLYKVQSLLVMSVARQDMIVSYKNYSMRYWKWKHVMTHVPSFQIHFLGFVSTMGMEVFGHMPLILDAKVCRK